MTQIPEKRSIFLSGKRFFLVLGLALLATGFSLIIVYSVIIKPDRVLAGYVNLTTGRSPYQSDLFKAETGDWVEFNVTTSNSSILRLIGEGVGEVLRVVNVPASSEVTYAQSFQISVTTDYQVEIDNMAVYSVYIFGYPNDVYYNNTFSGAFYLIRMPTYYAQLLVTGEVLLAVSCGFLLVPIAPYFLDKTKRLGTIARCMLGVAEQKGILV